MSRGWLDFCCFDTLFLELYVCTTKACFFYFVAHLLIERCEHGYGYGYGHGVFLVFLFSTDTSTYRFCFLTWLEVCWLIGIGNHWFSRNRYQTDRISFNTTRMQEHFSTPSIMQLKAYLIVQEEKSKGTMNAILFFFLKLRS